MFQFEQMRLREARDDLFGLLDRHPGGDMVLSQALYAGAIDGSVTWSLSRDCGCIKGWLAHAEGLPDCTAMLKADFEGLGAAFKQAAVAPIGSEIFFYSPIERFIFRDVREGDTPENSQVAATIRDWIEDWQREREAGVRL